jgi:pilus assembly protein CpaD
MRILESKPMRKPVVFFTLTLGLALAGCNFSNSESALQGGYPSDYRVRHPLIVSTHRAYVPHHCGQWQEDSGASNPHNAQNLPLYNHGCASQKNLGAMVANPNDLIEPRPMGPSDARRRNVVIEKWRQGQDPSTTYKIDDKNKTSGR